MLYGLYGWSVNLIEQGYEIETRLPFDVNF